MSPFGVDKKLGGDNKENDGWMEKCVSKVKAQGKDEGSAVAICKAQLQKMKGKKEEASVALIFHILDGTLDSLLEEEKKDVL